MSHELTKPFLVGQSARSRLLKLVLVLEETHSVSWTRYQRVFSLSVTFSLFSQDPFKQEQKWR